MNLDLECTAWQCRPSIIRQPVPTEDFSVPAIFRLLALLRTLK